MAKQNLSKKGVERFKKKKTPKGERGHRKQPGGPPGGASPHGAKPGRTRSLLRKKNYGAEKRNRGERKKKGGAAAASGGIQGYDRSQRLLLVGEGNLSMARALLRLFEGNGRNLIATTYDTEAELQEARMRGCCAAARHAVAAGRRWRLLLPLRSAARR